MNTKDIQTSNDSDLIGSCAAIQRAARSAHDLAITTNTGIVVVVDGKNVTISADELKRLRVKEDITKA
jgi:hypothetical protein